MNIHKNKNVKSGYSIKLVYQITAHYTELEIMNKIMQFFNGVSRVEYTADGRYVSYRVYKTKDIIKEIIPHLNRYPLQSIRDICYTLWCKSAQCINNKLHLTDDGLNRLLTYKAAFTKKRAAEIFKNKL